MTDDDLRALLRLAHAGDAPPPFRAPEPRRRRRWLPAAALGAAGVAALAWFLLRPRPPAPIASLQVQVVYPLDFLLDAPGADLLRTTPRFAAEVKEAFP